MFKTRFSADQPWNFGVIPSQYYASLSPRHKKALSLTDDELRRLDASFAMTLRAPAARKLDGLERLRLGLWYENVVIAVASHVKPAASFQRVVFSMTRRAYDYFTNSVLDRYGLVGFRCDEYEVVLGVSQEIIDGLRFWRFTDCNFREISLHDKILRDLGLGILLGYPLGDCFAFANHESSETGMETKVGHYSNPSLWSDEWRENIGNRAHEHLAKIYSDYVHL